MIEYFTLIFLMQHPPVTYKNQLFIYENIIIDKEVADVLQNSNVQISQKALDRIYAYASEALEAGKAG
jgi:hypothetical protein